MRKPAVNNRVPAVPLLTDRGIKPGRRQVMVAALLAGLTLATAGCGFRPLYGSRDLGLGLTEKLGLVEIGVISDRTGQQLRNILIDRFYTDGRPGLPTYRLDTSLQAAKSSIGVQKDASATRYRMTVTANYQLLNLNNQKVEFQTSSQVVVNYNVLQGQFATFATEQDALKRGIEQLGDEITSRVALFLDRDA